MSFFITSTKTTKESKKRKEDCQVRENLVLFFSYHLFFLISSLFSSLFSFESWKILSLHIVSDLFSLGWYCLSSALMFLFLCYMLRENLIKALMLFFLLVPVLPAAAHHDNDSLKWKQLVFILIVIMTFLRKKKKKQKEDRMKTFKAKKHAQHYLSVGFVSFLPSSCSLISLPKLHQLQFKLGFPRGFQETLD